MQLAVAAAMITAEKSGLQIDNVVHANGTSRTRIIARSGLSYFSWCPDRLGRHIEPYVRGTIAVADHPE
jgi:hypothetical protein